MCYTNLANARYKQYLRDKRLEKGINVNVHHPSGVKAMGNRIMSEDSPDIVPYVWSISGVPVLVFSKTSVKKSKLDYNARYTPIYPICSSSLSCGGLELSDDE